MSTTRLPNPIKRMMPVLYFMVFLGFHAFSGKKSRL
jgi:hypothetical protein